MQVLMGDDGEVFVLSEALQNLEICSCLGS